MPATTFLSFLSVYVYKTRESFLETCPLAILEALAAGLPVVAENRGGIRNLVVPGETGMLCDTLHEFHRGARTADESGAIAAVFGECAAMGQGECLTGGISAELRANSCRGFSRMVMRIAHVRCVRVRPRIDVSSSI